jgi:hypothetical protein
LQSTYGIPLVVTDRWHVNALADCCVSTGDMLLSTILEAYVLAGIHKITLEAAGFITTILRTVASASKLLTVSALVRSTRER